MVLLRTTILLIFPLILSCAGGNTPLWKAYTFDGTNFSPSSGTIAPTIWLRSGQLPTLAKPEQTRAASGSLPPGTGAVAGICYRQSSGGKTAGQTSFAPYPDEQIIIKNSAARTSLSRTDTNGYFTERLPAGSYELFCRGVRAEFRITQGETTLVPIRGGKRMAD